MTTVARNMHRGGAINKYLTGGFFGPIVDWVKGVGGAIGNLIDSIFIGPKGEVKIVETPDEVPPRGYRRPTVEEAIKITQEFNNSTKPVYDKTTGAYLPPSSAMREITDYPYAPSDTTIYYDLYPNGYQMFNNKQVDLQRRLFDALNSQFENEPQKSSTTKTPIRKKPTKSAQPKLKSDTLKVKLVE